MRYLANNDLFASSFLARRFGSALRMDHQVQCGGSSTLTTTMRQIKNYVDLILRLINTLFFRGKSEGSSQPLKLWCTFYAESAQAPTPKATMSDDVSDGSDGDEPWFLQEMSGRASAAPH
jgi:hypothetical protein